MSTNSLSIDSIKLQMQDFLNQVKSSLSETKSIAIAQAWKILQLAIAETVQVLEQHYNTLSGSDKKAVAMEYLSNFYDTVFTVIVVPGIPSVLQVLLKKYIKIFLMLLVSSSIDAMVTTFRQVGIFKSSVVSQSVKIKAKKARKKK